MKTAQALTLSSLLLLSFHAHADAASAKKALDAAGATMAAAVQRIEKDPPSTADLDAAHAAVDAFKVALDAAVPFEETDLEFAKAILSSRKLFREKRTYVDQRRAMVHIFEQRRTIDAAAATVTEKANKADAKDAGVKEFEEALAAIAALRKLVTDSRPFGKEDPKFASFLTEQESMMSKREKAIDVRATGLLVAKQRGQLDEATKALTAAMGPLAKTASDAQFKDADNAIIAVNKRLEEGKALEPKDAKYGAEAARVRNEVGASKKKMDELWSETGLTRLKAEIEPARKDLAAAAKGVRPRKASADALAEAKTAALVVRGLIEKFKPEAARSQAFAQYVAEVQVLLTEVENELQKKNIEAATNEVNQALKAIAKNAPADAAFEEANSAIGILEKTIATVNAKDPVMGPVVFDAKALVRDARAATTKRRTELEGDAQKKNIKTASNEVNQALKTIAKRSVPDEAFEEANAAINILEKTIATVNAKDSVMGPFVFDAKALIRDARAATNKRRIEIDVEKQKAKVEEERKNTGILLDSLGQPGLSKEKIAATESQVAKLVAALDAGAELIKKDREYGAYDREVRKRVTEMGTKIAGRKVQLAANDGRALLIEKTEWAKVKLEAAKQPDSTDAQLTTAQQAVEALNTTVEGQTAMEATDRAYMAQANKARDDFFKLVEQLERAKQVRELRKKTVEVLSVGSAAVSSAASADLRTQKTQYEKALAQFKVCTGEGGSMVKEYPMLSNVAVLLDGRPSTPKEVLGLCGQQTATTEKLLKDVIPFLAFEEGPKKAYEAAKKLQGSGKKTEAQAQFDECIATGIILGQRSPELKDRSFSVGGAETTLSALVQTCTKESKSLRGK